MRNSKRERWTVLFIVAIVMMMGYVFWDIVSPLSTTLKESSTNGGLSWTATEYGFFVGSYSIFNIFLLMLFLGGIILDRMGIRFTGIVATGMMLAGAAVCWWAISEVPFTETCKPWITLFGLIPSPLKTQVLVASIGFGIFGVGCDITGITISKIVTRWFTGHELASAMGIQVALARLGTAFAISMSPVLALSFGLSGTLLAGVLFLLAGFLLFLLYLLLFHKRIDKSEPAVQTKSEKGESAPSVGWKKAFGKLIANPGFWLIALLCVFFYGSVRPFLKFATDLLVSKYGLDLVTAGWITSLLPYGTIVLTPLFGHLYDRYGHGAWLMLAGCLLTLGCHVVLTLPFINTPWVATAVMIMLGVAFSLVPSAMWPSVPKIVPLQQLGTGYSMIYYVQNIGLMLIPIWVGRSIDANTAHLATQSADIAPQHLAHAYTQPMSIFTLLAAVAVLLALALLRIDKKRGFGLEQPNIQKQ